MFVFFVPFCIPVSLFDHPSFLPQFWPPWTRVLFPSMMSWSNFWWCFKLLLRSRSGKPLLNNFSFFTAALSFLSLNSLLNSSLYMMLVFLAGVRTILSSFFDGDWGLLPDVRTKLSSFFDGGWGFLTDTWTNLSSFFEGGKISFGPPLWYFDSLDREVNRLRILRWTFSAEKGVKRANLILDL